MMELSVYSNDKNLIGLSFAFLFFYGKDILSIIYSVKEILLILIVVWYFNRRIELVDKENEKRMYEIGKLTKKFLKEEIEKKYKMIENLVKEKAQMDTKTLDGEISKLRNNIIEFEGELTSINDMVIKVEVDTETLDEEISKLRTNIIEFKGELTSLNDTVIKVEVDSELNIEKTEKTLFDLKKEVSDVRSIYQFLAICLKN